MKVVDIPAPISFPLDSEKLSIKEQIIAYYEKAGPDYASWSKKYNMHFGYWTEGVNPMNREQMLAELNNQVLKRLGLKSDTPANLADFGCGLGASLRQAVLNFPKVQAKGITLVPWQVKQACQLNSKSNKTATIEIKEGDYCHTQYHDNSLDAVFAIESSCYATGAAKADLLNEIYRVLKPGGRFVIADGFLKREMKSTGFLKRVYDQLCTSWALTELGNEQEVRKHLLKLKFKNVKTEDVSMNIAPSVAHVPFAVLGFLMKQVLFGKERMTKERWDNLKSPLLTMILGSAQSYFGYYFISGTK